MPRQQLHQFSGRWAVITLMELVIPNMCYMDCLLLLWTTEDCIIVSDSFLLPYGRIIRPGTLLLDLVVLLWSGETTYPCLDPSGLGRRIYFAT